MKTLNLTTCFLLLVCTLGVRAQDISDYPMTPEEEYYSDDQVSPEAFGNEEDVQEEEELPYAPNEDIYPYEELDYDYGETYGEEY